MERSNPVRKPHTSSADLLVWSEGPPADPPPAATAATSGSRASKTSGGVSAVVFGGQITEEEEEAENLNKRKPCSGPKLREMTGSGIFIENENGESESDGPFAIQIAKQQTVRAISQISFSADESVSPKKPTTLNEAAKQRELSGTLDNDSDAKTYKQFSDAKCKELSGHDIFGPPPEASARPLAARNLELKGNFDFGEPTRNMHTSVKVSNPAGGPNNIMFSEEPVAKTSKKINNQKLQVLTGNDIFKGNAPPGSAENSMSSAKLKEMSGSNIFANGKAPSRDYHGGVRKPPGGESSIALV